jgi:pyridoxal phosphate enzyme (YggS family)
MMDTTATGLQTRIASVRAEIAAACQRAHRAPDAVTLVAVSKTFAAGQVAQAIEAGIRHLGENRVEEAVGKMSQVAALNSTPVEWHMVGHLQSRKARYMTRGFALLHSLDSVYLAERLSRLLAEQGATLDVLLEMNVSGEEAKQGWNAQHWRSDADQRGQVWQDVRQILALPGLRVRGLMTMAPIVEDPEQTRPVFAALRDLRDALANDFPGSSWADLSMGMSDDYPVAVEEGATLVRVGRAIFGART